MSRVDWEFISIIGIAGVVVAALVVVGQWLNSVECSSRAGIMGLPYSWGPIQGCMVQQDDRWVPMSSVRMLVRTNGEDL